ncbi:MAG: 30S ribosomal protein S6, partial [Lachnospiraceae bacterium]|nr:30S ribosomal protein S6 [Lachnospiraceae bacterium]
MNKYELCVVVNATIEDDAREKVVNKCKSYVERFGGTITEVDDWGKKKLAYEIQKMK